MTLFARIPHCAGSCRGRGRRRGRWGGASGASPPRPTPRWRRGPPPSCSSTCRTPAWTACPAPSSSAPTSACPRCRASAAGGRQLRPHLAGLRLAHAAGLVRRPRPDPPRPARHVGRVRRRPQRQRRVDLVQQGQDRHPLHAARSHGAARRRARARPTCHPPQQAADQALKAISPTTTVSTDGTARWPAGRPTSWCSRPRTRPRWSARCGSPSTASSTSRSGCRSSPRARPPRPSRSPSPRSTSAAPTRRSSGSTRRPGPRSPSARCPRTPAREAGRRTPTPRPHRRPRPVSPRSSAPAGPPSSSPPCRRRPGRLRRPAVAQGHARAAAPGHGLVGLGPPAAGHAVLGAAHRRRPARRRRGDPADAVRGAGRW